MCKSSDELVTLLKHEQMVKDTDFLPRHRIKSKTHLNTFDLNVFRYPYLPFSPLNRVQASTCLHSLVQGINCALIELHECGLAHNDVRLPNVCFNDKYEPVLIDLDRCSKSGKISTTYGASCMYLFPATGDKFERRPW